jgi:hypothetical protein
VYPVFCLIGFKEIHKYTSVDVLQESVDIDDIDCSEPLPFKSYIRSHKLFTISKERVLSKISSVHVSLLHKLETKLLQNIAAL